MERVLLLTRKSEKEVSLISYLRTAWNWEPTLCYDEAEARELAQEHSFDLILINAPLDKERGDSIATYLAEHTSSPILLLIQTSFIEAQGDELEAAGILVVGKPVVKVILNQAIRFALVSRNRLARLQRENVKLQDQLEQFQLINRAKLVLIKDLSMSEEQAHKYIEQQAMNRRLPKHKIAEIILRTYEH